jgi:acyl-CoA hydrolase
MDSRRLIDAKKRSLVEAAALVRPKDTLVVPLGPGQPASFLHALGERDDWEGLQIFGALALAPFKLFTRRGVTYVSGFYGPFERALEEAGYDVRFVAADFRRYESLARTMAPRVMATSVALPDAGGRFSLSLHAGATVDELHRCGRDPDRLLVVEVNPRLPRTLGLPPDHPHCLRCEEVDVIVESGEEPVALPEQEATAVERAIAAHVSEYIPNGATLQTGIGGIPSAVVQLLAEGSGGDYGIHSEMFTTGLMKLHLAGKITNKKGIYDGVSIATFALGTKQLYAWLDGQEAVRFLPVDLVNEPGLISRNRNMISINGALCVDLAGQVAADTIRGRQFSGIGGHEDFVAGAAFASCGRSLICMPSTATVSGQRVSRIAATLPTGTMVTTPRHQVDVVITEHGAAELAGKTTEERAEALIAIADPSLRRGLREEAAALARGGSH